ncbi:F-box/FBD/LRR-repeat protein At2g04230 isoform X4 [Sorghum bicolor]|uniref:F-box/FBD/LRR-repeat protein At2g04230 isoform X4 n=1 Tax=Sorghum bicolor TaxID=4558 RepID=UPI000B425AC4|nr:F-box/FBD/LRR-repeat protein At2g04230 isoform X4 [Sorghum bicolor]|eukprot:XP_021317442.1 F-box/FBD/LRR-repeat protein At2g04230 isoform X4 [Sorghum bicolor]
MAADQRRSRRSGGEDRISGLPDELLHDILVRLRCARAAARTSVLSRRWRHVWAHLPELRLDQRRRPTASGLLFLDTIDAALAGYSAPTLERLSISIPSNSNAPSSVVGPGARIAPWLHFAAARVVGELNLFLRAPQTFVVATPEVVGEEAVLELPALSLTKRFDEVDELDHLSIDLKWQDVARYESFLNETNKLLKCKSLCISLLWEHALVPVMWHLLRSCNGTKRLRVHLWGPWSQRVMHSCLPACPYRLEESLKIDVIDLSSLEEVEISGFSGSHEQMELVEFLSSNARILKRLRINYHNCRRPKEAREKVRSMCHPNLKVEFFVFHEGRQVLVE